MVSRRRVVMVTGSSTGIGRAIALKLAQQGFSLLVHGRTCSDALNSCQDQLKEMGASVGFLTADFEQFGDADFEPWFQQAAKAADSLDGQLVGWVNNAGADVLTGKAGKAPFGEKLKRIWSVDVRSTLMLSRAAGAYWNQHQVEGSIVNIGWDQAQLGLPGDSGQMFAASKGAIMSMTASLAKSFAPWVRVNCVAPGWIQTAWGQQADPEWDAWVCGQSLLERWGRPEDVAALAGFLMSTESSYLNGQVIAVNGGLRTTGDELENRLKKQDTRNR